MYQWVIHSTVYGICSEWFIINIYLSNYSQTRWINKHSTTGNDGSKIFNSTDILIK